MSQNQIDTQFDLSDAPDTSTPFTNVGKLTLKQVYKLWENKVAKEVTREVFKAAKDKQLDSEGKERNAKQIDMQFAVDLQEFSPNLQFTYERNVTVDGADWRVIVAPAIEEVMGKGSMVKGDTSKNVADTRNATLAKLNGKYIAYQDVPQVPRRNAAPGAKQYNTIRITQVFESREAAYAAHVAMRGASANGAGPAATSEWTPTDYSDDTWASVKPDLVKAVGDALASAKTPPAKAKAKTEAIKKFATEYGATEAQVDRLLNS